MGFCPFFPLFLLLHRPANATPLLLLALALRLFSSVFSFFPITRPPPAVLDPALHFYLLPHPLAHFRFSCLSYLAPRSMRVRAGPGPVLRLRARAPQVTPYI